MKRTIIDTADRLRPGDHIQAPDGKWMTAADITYATGDGPLGAFAVLLVNPAMGTYGARLLTLGSGYTIDIRRDANRTLRPYPADEHTQIRRRGLGYEVWDTISLEWIFVLPGTWKDEFGGALEADKQTLNALLAAA